MLPKVSREVCDIVGMQLNGDYVKYLQTIVSKLKNEQPELHNFLLDNAKEFLVDLKELDGDEKEAYIIMSIVGLPFMVYEMLRNQDEANELNEVLGV